MKKLIYVSVFGLLFFCFRAEAQNVAIGVRGGISIPNLSAGGSEQNPLNSGYSSRQGPDFGLFADFRISGLFSIEPMLQYSSQGGKKDGFQALTTPPDLAAAFQAQNQPVPAYVYANYNSMAKLNYLMIPILAKFGWNLGKTSPWRFYADAGPFAGFLLNAHQVTSGSSMIYADAGGTQPITQQPVSFNGNTDIKNQLHTFNLGIEGNVGFAYKVGAGNIFIEGGGNYGFLNIQKGTSNGKNNTGAATADVGYAYWF